MKVLPVIFLLTAAVCGAQTYPAIGVLTITPSEPTASDEVMIITSVQAPGQGHRVSKSQHVSAASYSLGLRACYYSGPASAIQTHVDTFYVGKLQDGYYAVSFKARLSTATGNCAPSDSSEEATYLQVEPATLSLRAQAGTNLAAWPNPCADALHIRGLTTGLCRVISATGQVICVRRIDQGILSGLSFLQPGIYFLEIDSGQGRFLRYRFAKQ